MATLPTIAVCYLAGVDSTQIEQRRGPSRITDALPDHPILDMRDRTPDDLGEAERERMVDVEIAFILDMPDYIFDAFPNLKWIHSLKTGHDFAKACAHRNHPLLIPPRSPLTPRTLF